MYVVNEKDLSFREPRGGMLWFEYNVASEFMLIMNGTKSTETIQLQCLTGAPTGRYLRGTHWGMPLKGSSHERVCHNRHVEHSNTLCSPAHHVLLPLHSFHHQRPNHRDYPIWSCTSNAVNQIHFSSLKNQFPLVFCCGNKKLIQLFQKGTQVSPQSLQWEEEMEALYLATLNWVTCSKGGDE